MEAREENFFNDFLNQSMEIIIPDFQRPYSWEKEQVQELWDDILTIGKDDTYNDYFYRINCI